MKRWWIPVVAILGFFAVLSTLFKTLGPADSMKPINNSKIESAMSNMNGATDETKIKFQSKNATTGEKVPSWGSLAKSATPKVESLSFKGPAKDTKVAAKDTKKDKKKKKKLADKKKKKKKFEVKKLKSTPKAKIADDATGFDDSANAVGGMSTPKKQKDPKALPETYEEWEEYVLNPPSIDNLMTLIKYHQARLVPDDIFFKLSEKMVRSNTEQIRRFGLIALSSSPSLESFILLAFASSVERSSNLQSMITSNYQTYSAIQYLNVLRPALTSTNATVRYQAAVSLTQSASQNIKPSPDTIGGRGRTGSSSTQQYQSFLNVLNQLMNGDPNGSVQTAAREAYDTISRLTANSITVTAN